MSGRTRTLIVTFGLAAAVIVIGGLAVNSIYSSASAKAVVRTTTVQRGTVAATVTATGNVAPAAALSVNFQTGGVVTEIDVKPGDQVRAGQPLAKVDDTVTNASLASAQAALTSAEAGLASASQPLTPAIAAQNAAAMVTAQQQVAVARTSLANAEQSAAVNAVGYQNSLDQTQAQLARDTNQLTADQATCSTGTASSPTGQGTGQSCSSVQAQDQGAIAKDNDALVNAHQQKAAGQLKDQQSVQQAASSLTSAQQNVTSAQAGNNAKAAASPSAVAQAQSQVSQAQASLMTAQKNEAGTTLTAPTDGTVAIVNGIVGQTVAAGGTSSAASSASSSGNTGTGSSTSTFLTLDNVTTLQVVAGFAEADASRVQVGQSASVSLNALPNQPVNGQVSKVDVASTVVSNVVTYNVTVTLSDPPAAAKPGMTANVNVVVSQHDDVLHVPTADVTTRGGVSTVTVLNGSKQVPKIVTTGLVGDQSTEVTSGVTEGENVVQPTVTITTAGGTGTGTTGNPNRAGGGGLGGGGFGGGGLGGGGLGGGGG